MRFQTNAWFQDMKSTFDTCNISILFQSHLRAECAHKNRYTSLYTDVTKVSNCDVLQQLIN